MVATAAETDTKMDTTDGMGVHMYAKGIHQTPPTTKMDIDSSAVIRTTTKEVGLDNQQDRGNSWGDATEWGGVHNGA